MENLKKWFNFSDTISGTTFLIRWVIAWVVQFVGGFSMGYGIALGGWTHGLVVVGLIIASAGIALQFSTLQKRSKAIFSKPIPSLVFYMAYLAISILNGFTKGHDLVLDGFIGLTLLVMFLFAIFKNSGTPSVNHLG